MSEGRSPILESMTEQLEESMSQLEESMSAAVTKLARSARSWVGQFFGVLPVEEWGQSRMTEDQVQMDAAITQAKWQWIDPTDWRCEGRDAAVRDGENHSGWWDV
jgi:hypothetical protein